MKISFSLRRRGPLYKMMALSLVLNPLSFFFKSIFGAGITYYVEYVCWILLLICSLVLEGNKISKSHVVIVATLMVTFIAGTLHGGVIFVEPFKNVHIGIFFCTSLLFTMSCGCYTKLTKEEVYSLCRLIVIMGVLSVLFAITYQSKFAIEALKNNSITYNSWNYRSFFGQRNVYAEYCFLACVAALNNFFFSRKKRYLLFIGLMGLQIFITNSRASTVAYVLLVGIAIIMISHHKWVSVSIIAIISIVIVLNIMGHGISDIATERMIHSMRGMHETSTKMRVAMWNDMIQLSIREHGILFGFGFGAVEVLLMGKYGVGSGHNAYMDLFFAGGIVLLLIYLFIMGDSVVKIYRNPDNHFKAVFLAGFFAYAVHSMAESGMVLFASNFFSITATMLFVVMPRMYSGVEVASCESSSECSAQ